MGHNSNMNTPKKFNRIHIEATLRILLVLALLPSILFFMAKYAFALSCLLFFFVFVPLDPLARHVFHKYKWFKKYYFMLLTSGIITWFFIWFDIPIAAPFYLCSLVCLHIVYHSDIVRLEKQLFELTRGQ